MPEEAASINHDTQKNIKNILVVNILIIYFTSIGAYSLQLSLTQIQSSNLFY